MVFYPQQTERTQQLAACRVATVPFHWDRACDGECSCSSGPVLYMCVCVRVLVSVYWVCAEERASVSK